MRHFHKTVYKRPTQQGKIKREYVKNYEWTLVNLWVMTSTKDFKETTGEMCGPVAVHERIEDTANTRAWQVTHVATGTKIATVDTKDHAFAVAEDLLKYWKDLLEKITEAWMAKKWKEVHDVRKYCNYIDSRGVYVPATTFYQPPPPSKTTPH